MRMMKWLHRLVKKPGKWEGLNWVLKYFIGQSICPILKWSKYSNDQNTQIVKIRKRQIYLNGPMDKKVKNLKFSSSRHCWNKMLCCRIGRSASSLWNYRWRRYWIGSWRTRRKITASLFAHSNLKWPKNIFLFKKYLKQT